MASYSYGLAKGLREPCSPYREAYYFGAPLNEPSADGWNCLPELVGQATSFNLSAIPEGREAVVALLKVQNTPAGTLDFKAEWYRNRDNRRLFTLTWSYQANAGGWTYCYAYLGHVDWEISENGDYRVEFTVSGALDYFKVIQFTISGIREEVIPEPIPTGAMGWISERFAAAAGFFYLMYLEALDWWPPFDKVSEFFYALSQLCADLSWDFADFSIQVEHIIDRIAEVLSWDAIWDQILARVPNLEEIRDWFYYWRDYVWGVITDWGAPVLSFIKELINTATQGLNNLIVAWDNFWKVTFPEWTSKLDNLRGEWDNFWSVTFPLLVSFDWLDTWWTSTMGDVVALLNSAFIEREPFWAGWQEIRDEVTGFFEGPLDWLEGKFADWFLGAE